MSTPLPSRSPPIPDTRRHAALFFGTAPVERAERLQRATHPSDWDDRCYRKPFPRGFGRVTNAKSAPTLPALNSGLQSHLRALSSVQLHALEQSFSAPRLRHQLREELCLYNLPMPAKLEPGSSTSRLLSPLKTGVEHRQQLGTNTAPRPVRNRAVGFHPPRYVMPSDDAGVTASPHDKVAPVAAPPHETIPLRILESSVLHTGMTSLLTLPDVQIRFRVAASGLVSAKCYIKDEAQGVDGGSTVRPARRTTVLATASPLARRREWGTTMHSNPKWAPRPTQYRWHQSLPHVDACGSAKEVVQALGMALATASLAVTDHFARYDRTEGGCICRADFNAGLKALGYSHIQAAHADLLFNRWARIADWRMDNDDILHLSEMASILKRGGTAKPAEVSLKLCRRMYAMPYLASTPLHCTLPLAPHAQAQRHADSTG